MRPWYALTRTLPLAAALALAACDGGGNGFNTDRLTPAEVAGVYSVCQLRFVPTQTALPAADVRTQVINPAPPNPRPAPSLSLGGQQYDLVYTRKSDNFLQQMRGGVAFGVSEISLDVFAGDDPSATAAELLLPGALTLRFQASPRRLSTAAQGSAIYSVRRADYARAAGISEEGLATRINGRLIASFSQGACS